MLSILGENCALDENAAQTPNIPSPTSSLGNIIHKQDALLCCHPGELKETTRLGFIEDDPRQNKECLTEICIFHISVCASKLWVSIHTCYMLYTTPRPNLAWFMHIREVVNAVLLNFCAQDVNMRMETTTIRLRRWWGGTLTKVFDYFFRLPISRTSSPNQPVLHTQRKVIDCMRLNGGSECVVRALCRSTCWVDMTFTNKWRY